MKNYIFIILSAILPCAAQAQCFPDRHSTNFFDGWISCEVAKSPNPLREPGHFIMYDFGKMYKLGQMTIWNTNDPSRINWGMRDVAIDYSQDGEYWIHAGDYVFSQATGLSTYEGEQGPHLNDIEARYLLITGLTNYGGECFGLSEMRVEGEEVIISDVDDIASLDCVDVSLYPNPFAEKINLNVAAGCSGELRYSLFDALGHEILSQRVDLSNGQNNSYEIGSGLPAGSYMLFLEFGGKSVKRSIVKIERT
jgi:hypothetical protein